MVGQEALHCEVAGAFGVHHTISTAVWYTCMALGGSRRRQHLQLMIAFWLFILKETVLLQQLNVVITFQMLLESVFQPKPYAHFCAKVVCSREDRVYGPRWRQTTASYDMLRPWTMLVGA